MEDATTMKNVTCLTAVLLMLGVAAFTVAASIAVSAGLEALHGA
jgi:hypothetical protein